MYDHLAECYDAFMADVDYDAWADYACSFLPQPPALGMDVGCGTGKLTLELISRGYKVTGSDVSAQMLEKAQAAARSKGLAVQFICQSAEQLRSMRPLDFITAQCDVVNYLARPEKFFVRAASSLKNGGVLAFDISSAYKLKEVLAGNVFTDENDDVTYIWENAIDKKQTRVDMRLTFFKRNGSGTFDKLTETQTQYVHDADVLTEKLKKAGFTSVKTYGFGTRRAPKSDDQRLFFVARKEI